MNGDIKNLFKFIGLLATVGVAGLLMFLHFNFLLAGFYNDFANTKEFTYLGSTSILVVLFIFTLITYYPLRFLPTENWKDGIWDITLFLVYFPVIVSFFFSVIIFIFIGVPTDSGFSLILTVTFFAPYSASYKKMLETVHLNKLRKPKIV